MRLAHFGLFAADDDKLLVLSLPKTNANGQVQTHGPELDVTRPSPIHCIHAKVHEAEDVDHQDGEKHEADLSHFHNGVVTLEPQVNACCVQKDGVDDDEGKERNAISIQIGGTKIEASRIGIYHVEEGDGDLTQ